MNLKITAFCLALAFAFCFGVQPARAQLLLTIDETDPGHVIITATGNFSALSVSDFTVYDGVTLANFFTHAIADSNTSPPVLSSTLKPGAASQQNPTANSLIYDSASEDDFYSPENYVDLNLYNGTTPSVTQLFDDSQAAFVGTLTLDLSSSNYAAYLPSAGAGGDIYEGYSNASSGGGGIPELESLSINASSNTPIILGQWSVIAGPAAVPEPSSYLLGLCAITVLGLCAHRRSCQAASKE